MSEELPQPPPIASRQNAFHEVRDEMRALVDDRDWSQFHTPRNLLLALNGEMGELCEIFQWKGEVKVGLLDFSDKEKLDVREEAADVLAYLIRFSDVCGFDLYDAFKAKMQKVRKKYPVDLCKGKSDKYTAYSDAVSIRGGSAEESVPESSTQSEIVE